MYIIFFIPIPLCNIHIDINCHLSLLRNANSKLFYVL